MDNTAQETERVIPELEEKLQIAEEELRPKQNQLNQLRNTGGNQDRENVRMKLAKIVDNRHQMETNLQLVQKKPNEYRESVENLGGLLQYLRYPLYMMIG